MFAVQNTLKSLRYSSLYRVFRNPIRTFLNSKNNLCSSVKFKDRLTVRNVKDLAEFIKQDRQFYLKLLTKIFDTVDFDKISREEAILLLNCCGNFVPDSSRETRDKVCQEIYHNLLKHNKMDVSIYQKYIEICTENGTQINIKEFLDGLKCRPDQKTYSLLLENVCDNGNVEDALTILECMKQYSIPVDEDTFCALILAHTMRSGIKGAETVLNTMIAAQIPETDRIKFAILKGISRTKNHDEFVFVTQRFPLQLKELQILDILKSLAINDTLEWIKELQPFYAHIPITKDFIAMVKALCIHLVHLDRSEQAFKIYRRFVTPGMEENYGYFILKEMLHARVDRNRILSIARYLRDHKLNEYCIKNLTGLALKHYYTEVAWDLLENLSELRPHYFWPLLISAHRTAGEKGIVDTIQRMTSLNLKLDSETLKSYVLPFFDLRNPKLVVEKLKELGLTVKEIVNSMIIILMDGKMLKDAVTLYDNFNVGLLEEDILNALPLAWYKSKDSLSAVSLLQRCCEQSKKETNLIYEFLAKCLDLCKNSEDLKAYVQLVKVVTARKLRISAASAEVLQELASQLDDKKLSMEIVKAVDELLDFNLKSEPHVAYIPHPGEMNLEQLECHLIELREKQLETRGVLRKLIQLHSSKGNIERVKQLQDEFLAAGYKESLGMKSSLMYSYVKSGNLNEALEIYQQIKNADPSFNVDDFKIIDLTTLLVKENRTEDALKMMGTEIKSKRHKTTAIDRNLVELLKAFSDEHQQMAMFDCLVRLGYTPNNVILGPLIRTYLKKGDVKCAVKTYVTLAEKYRCTPLQFEVISEVVKSMDKELLQEVITSTENIHGHVSTKAVLVATLIELSQQHALDKIFANNKLDLSHHLMKRCDRWVKEKKIDALKLLAKYCEKMPEILDASYIYKCIMQVYVTNNDCESALKFHNWLLEEEKPVSRELEDMLSTLLVQNRFEIPSSIRIKAN